MIRAPRGEGPHEPAPLRQIALFNGRISWRCDECGCGVTADHVPGSPECEESYRERIASRSERD